MCPHLAFASLYVWRISCLRTLRACFGRLVRRETQSLTGLVSVLSSPVAISAPDMRVSSQETDRMGPVNTLSPLSLPSPAAPLTLVGSSAGVDAALDG